MLIPIAYTVVSAFASTNGPDKSRPPRLTPPLQDDVGAPQSYIVDAWIGGYACCDCGWKGRRRWHRSFAVHDAVRHFAATKHHFEC
ncbi:hypothetical protein [Mycolicibacterium gadium]|uniref:hypothetical protein n=1 Tax=Mycolicibacterium gadium TaxID=1794 RepID=UPI0009F60AB3